jgi:hypothetical protein
MLVEREREREKKQLTKYNAIIINIITSSNIYKINLLKYKLYTYM